MTRKTMTLTVKDVADRLEQAAQTLRKMPSVRIAGFRSFWPPIVYSVNEAYGWEPARHVRSAPTGKEIDEMDEALRWLLWLTPEEAKLVFLRANGIRWKVLEWRFGFCRTKLHSMWRIAIFIIVHEANKNGLCDSSCYKKVCAQNSSEHFEQNRA